MLMRQPTGLFQHYPPNTSGSKRNTLEIKVRRDQAVFSLSGGTESEVALDAFGPRMRRSGECVQSILVPGTRARSFNVCPRCSR
eukprot:scaffold3475_cov246-Prasinococcus_capsulatus_cf.AAC.3